MLVERRGRLIDRIDHHELPACEPRCPDDLPQRYDEQLCPEPAAMEFTRERELGE